MVAVATSAAPLPIFLAGHFASDQINVHLLFRCLPLVLGVLSPNSSAQQQINSMATAPPFCTISLSSSLMLLLSLFSAFPSDCRATLSHFNVHLMPDGPRLQLDVDEIILTLWHVLVLAGMCRIAFLKLKTAI